MAKQESTIEVAGRQIKLSSLDKVLYPKAGFTKGQVVDYMVRIAPVLLPHLAGRPLTLKRYPEGVEGLFFLRKELSQTQTRLGQDRKSLERRQQSFHVLLRGRSTAHPRMAGQPR